MHVVVGHPKSCTHVLIDVSIISEDPEMFVAFLSESHLESGHFCVGLTRDWMLERTSHFPGSHR